VSQKVLTFKLSVTLSDLNRFSNFLHCWKAYEICYKIRTTLPTYVWKLKIQIFCRYSADMEESANNCILSAQILITIHVWLCMLSVFMCLQNIWNI